MTDPEARNKYRVLIVDNEQGEAATLSEFLHGTLEVLVASSAEEALRRLQMASVHVLCCSHEMTGMDGVRFLRRALALPEPPCILWITSAAEMREQQLEGLSGVIVKPYDGKALVERVSRLCRIAETRRRVASARSSIHQRTTGIESEK